MLFATTTGAAATAATAAAEFLAAASLVLLALLPKNGCQIWCAVACWSVVAFAISIRLSAKCSLLSGFDTFPRSARETRASAIQATFYRLRYMHCNAKSLCESVWGFPERFLKCLKILSKWPYTPSEAQTEWPSYTWSTCVVIPSKQ
eukprot:scpid45710/ scgid26656/ 